MRLLHVIDDAVAGGGTRTYVLGLARILREKGWTNGLLATRLPDETSQFDWKRTRGGTPDKDAALAWQFKPDAALLHTVDSARFATRLANGIPTYSYEHDYRHISPGNSRFFQRSETFCENGFGLQCMVKPYTERCNNRRPDRVARSIGRVRAWRHVWPRLSGVLCASQFVADLFERDGVPRMSIHVVGYFAEAPVSPAIDGRRDVLFVGRTLPAKGAHHLIRAFASVARALAAPRLMIVGGPRVASLQQLSRRLGIADRVDFPGWLAGDALEAAFARAAVVVLPSVWPEAFGIVGIEAQVRGIPVVATDVGGIREWLNDGRGGVLVAPGKDALLTDAMMMLLKDPAKARAIGAEGADHARRAFSCDAHLERLLPVIARA
jgi:glycosyltransferase involved in cell wall biosynthesis